MNETISLLAELDSCLRRVATHLARARAPIGVPDVERVVLRKGKGFCGGYPRCFSVGVHAAVKRTAIRIQMVGVQTLAGAVQRAPQDSHAPWILTHREVRVQNDPVHTVVAVVDQTV